MKTVLFICSGNTCRSPIAEAIFNELVDEYPRLKALDFRASSAGTFAAVGAQMTPEAEEALEELGFKPNSKHRASSFSQELAEESDLILAMQEQHLEELTALAPEAEDRIHTLKGYSVHVDGYTGSEDYDIEDPFRESSEVYLECAKEIKEAIEGALNRLNEEWTVSKAASEN